jgi:hypothetical protein
MTASIVLRGRNLFPQHKGAKFVVVGSIKIKTVLLALIAPTVQRIPFWLITENCLMFTLLLATALIAFQASFPPEVNVRVKHALVDRNSPTLRV